MVVVVAAAVAAAAAVAVGAVVVMAVVVVREPILIAVVAAHGHYSRGRTAYLKFRSFVHSFTCIRQFCYLIAAA